jgi:hypothetical protein
MAKRTAGQWAWRVAAFVLAGAAVAFCASILASAIGLGDIGVAVVTVAFLALIGYRVLSIPDGPEQSPSEEQS